MVTANGTITVITNNTIILISEAGTDNQTLCFNTLITNITYATTGATGATFSGLPAGVNGTWVANIVTISGTSTVSGTFNYMVTLTGGCGIVTAIGTITVKPNFIAGTASSDQTICYNATPASLTSTDATGGSSPYTYQWQINNSGWQNINGATTLSYSPGTLTTTTQYRLAFTDAGMPSCGTVYSNTVTIIVTPNNTITLTSAAGTDNQTDCTNTSITNIIYTTSGATGATVGGLPTGVNGTWAANVLTISGTPTTSGTFNYMVTLIGGCGMVTANGTITVITNNTIILIF